MRTIATFNALHLGDNLVHLHFLRAMAKAYPELHFTHGAPDSFLWQLYPLWEDLPNLQVTSIGATPPGAINAWRGVEGHWYHHPLRNDFARYHLRWFELLAQRMGGLQSPFTKPEDLLFDYPSLQRENQPISDHGISRVLIINSEPNSGQWSGFSRAGFGDLIEMLMAAGKAVKTTSPNMCGAPCTGENNMDVTAIGKLSQTCDVIIGCVTGPMWPCLNVWNAAKPLRIHLLDTERVEFCANTVHLNSLSLVPEILQQHKLL